MDQISLHPAALLVLVLIVLASIVLAAYFGMRLKQWKDDLKEYCPEAEIFIRGRKERKPVMAIHDSGSSYVRFLLAETDNRASWTYKAEEFEVKFRPDFSSHCEADRFYGDLEVYHAAAHHPFFLSSKSVMCLNNIVDLLSMEKFENLRFLRTQDLTSLMQTNAQDLHADCQMFLKEYAKKNVGQPLPKSVDDFVRLIQEAVKEFSAMPLEGSDSPESVYLDIVQTIDEKPALATPKGIADTIVQIVSRLRGKGGDEDCSEKEPEEPKAFYQRGIKHIWKLKGFSYKYAFVATPTATTSQDVQNMETLSREQGKSDTESKNSDFFKWVFAIIAVLGVIIFGVVVLFNVL